MPTVRWVFLDGIRQLHLLAIFQEPRRVAHDLCVQRVRHSIARLVAVVGDPVRPIHGQQKRVQVKIVQVGRATADLCQQVGAANHLIQRTRADRGQNLAHFLRIEGDQVHHLVGIAGELATQGFVLRTDAHRAGVRLALTHHDTAHRDQRGGADAVFLGAHHRGHDNVAAGAQAAIGPQGDTVTQVVHRQNLMRFGQAHFPRQAGILDRGRRRRAGATIVAGDQDDVGLRLGHAGSNRAHARRRDQLHRHLAARVDLLEVIDQLRQVFDRIDVVVRRRRDQGHTLGRVTQSRDQFGDLHARKLATLRRAWRPGPP